MSTEDKLRRALPEFFDRQTKKINEIAADPNYRRGYLDALANVKSVFEALAATQEQRDLLKIGTDAIIQRHFERHRLTLSDASEPEELRQLSKWNETYRPYAEADAKTVLEAIGLLTTSQRENP